MTEPRWRGLVVMVLGTDTHEADEERSLVAMVLETDTDEVDEERSLVAMLLGTDTLRRVPG
ncbi:MAG: hypothetical protein WA857_18120 [Candidatus Acidiferrum sp.]